MMSHEYAFDVKLFAVIRITAVSEARARLALQDALDSAAIDLPSTAQGTNVKITEASVYVDDELGPYLYEIDGEEVA